METTEPQYCKKCACEISIANPKPSMLEITITAATFFGKKTIDILGPKRQSFYVKPRYFAMYYMIQKGYRLTEIGIFFNKDHSTVIHARKSIENMFFTSESETEEYYSFEKLLN